MESHHCSQRTNPKNKKSNPGKDGSDGNIATPDKSPQSNSVTLQSLIEGSRVTLITNPVLMVLDYIAMCEKMDNHRRVAVQDYYKNASFAGVGQEEQKTLDEEVPNIQKQLQKDLGMVSTDQKVVSRQINDVKEKLKKIQRSRKERVLYTSRNVQQGRTEVFG